MSHRLDCLTSALMTTALHSLAVIWINLRLVILDSIDVFALLIFDVLSHLVLSVPDK